MYVQNDHAASWELYEKMSSDDRVTVEAWPHEDGVGIELVLWTRNQGLIRRYFGPSNRAKFNLTGHALAIAGLTDGNYVISHLLLSEVPKKGGNR
jgi:hypothetical protein